jgi:hypothetical protein
MSRFVGVIHCRYLSKDRKIIRDQLWPHLTPIRSQLKPANRCTQIEADLLPVYSVLFHRLTSCYNSTG